MPRGRLPKGARNAVQELSKACFTRRKTGRDAVYFLDWTGIRPTKNAIENQMRCFETGMRLFEHMESRNRTLKSWGGKDHTKTILELLKRKEFSSTIREVLRKRRRKGTVVDPLLNFWWFYFIDFMVDFSKSHGFRSMKKGIEAALKDEKLRMELVERLVETNSQLAEAGRWEAMTVDMIKQMKRLGMKRPVIIDYGTGAGQSTAYTEKRLKEEGITPGIIATDKQVSEEAKELLSGTRPALVEHDLRRRSFFGRFRIRGERRADVIRLGLVLQYTLRENAAGAIRNVMADVRDGGLIVVGGLGIRKKGVKNTQNKYAIYRKIDRNHIIKISSN